MKLSISFHLLSNTYIYLAVQSCVMFAITVLYVLLSEETAVSPVTFSIIG